MNHFAIALFCGVSMTALAMAMDKYQTDWLGRELSARSNQVLRCVGWLALAVSLVPVLQARSPAMALIAWFGHLNAAAALVVVALIVITRWRLRLATKSKAKAKVSG